MKPKKRAKPKPIRYMAIKDNAFIKNVEKTIEKEYKLPTGSVRMVMSNGRDAPLNIRLRKLLKDWDE